MNADDKSQWLSRSHAKALEEQGENLTFWTLDSNVQNVRTPPKYFSTSNFKLLPAINEKENLSINTGPDDKPDPSLLTDEKDNPSTNTDSRAESIDLEWDNSSIK